MEKRAIEKREYISTGRFISSKNHLRSFIFLPRNKSFDIKASRCYSRSICAFDWRKYFAVVERWMVLWRNLLHFNLSTEKLHSMLKDYSIFNIFYSNQTQSEKKASLNAKQKLIFDASYFVIAWNFLFWFWIIHKAVNSWKLLQKGFLRIYDFITSSFC